MEDYHNLHPGVKRVVQNFQSAATRSLSGPNIRALSLLSNLSMNPKMSLAEYHEYQKALSAAKKYPEDINIKDFHPHPFPIQQIPIFAPVDTSRSERSDTILIGETIACFTVGGEKRLCLPQILNTVLQRFDLNQINAVCDELHIFCSRCNHVQLETLKVMNILPSSAPSCGLITKTDAERLCHTLIERERNPTRSLEPPSHNSFRVYHECFGKSNGVFNPDAYTSPDSLCIRCVDCSGMFSPSRFVCHSHKSLENRTCHWGFDSANWRSYLLLAKDQNLSGKLQDVMDEVKARFDPTRKQQKRRQVSPCDCAA